MSTELTQVFNPELHHAPTHTNVFSLTDQTVSPAENVGGWYYTESLTFGVVYVEDKINTIVLNFYATWYQGKVNYLDRANPTIANIIMSRIGPFRFSLTDDRYIYNYNINEQQFEMDLNNPISYQPGNIGFFPIMMKKWKNPDARFWDYFLRTADPGTTFNEYQKVFNLMYNHSKSGRVSGFSNDSVAIPVRNVNPYDTDFSQIKRSVGGRTLYDYNALYETLLSTGLERRYPVKKFIYWPEPGSATGLTEDERQGLIWYVNQQRYNYLAFVPHVTDENEDNFAMLIPGNRVVMKHSGTRLDDIELRLSITGHHSGARPDNKFTNNNFHNNWALFSIRLPLVITEFNNEIWYSYPGSTEQVFRIPVGNYYTTDLIDYINDHFPIPHLTGLNDERDATVPRDALYFLAASPGFATEVTFNSPNKQVNPSSFFGQAGWDIGYLFPSDTKTTVDFLLFETASPVSNNMFPYRVHTPLNTDEVRLLIHNMNNITIGSFHGPVRNDMAPDNFAACMSELSTAASTEVHVLTSPWSRKSDSLLDELYISNKRLFQDLNDNAPITYDVLYQPTSNNSAIIGNLRSIVLRLTGVGHPGEFSEYYKAGPYRTINQGPPRAIDRLVPRNPGDLLIYPVDAKVKYEGQYYSLAGREVEVPAVNYLEDAKWLVTYALPDGTPAFDYLPYNQYETITSAAYPDKQTTIPTGEVIIAEPNPAAASYNAVLAAGNNVTTTGVTGKLVIAEPYNASTPLTNAAAIKGNIALVIRGGVTFGVKATNCIAAGAIGMIVVNTIAPVPNMGGIPADFPAMAVTALNGNYIHDNVDMNTIATIRANRISKLGGVIVPGEWIVGYFREDKIRQALNRPSLPVPKIGYLTHYSSASGVQGNIQAQPWYEPQGGQSRQAASFNAASILTYFNLKKVQHFYGDITNTSGGNAAIIESLNEHMGSDRFYTYSCPNDNLTYLQTFEATGKAQWFSAVDLYKLGEEKGFIQYKYTKSIRNCDPSSVATVFPPEALFGGPAPVDIPGLSTSRNILWITNGSTISATQAGYLNLKGTSIPPTSADPAGLQRNRYSGNYGNNVQLIAYGVYDRTFCTGGNYNSYINWYQKTRESTEFLQIPSEFAVDRWEGAGNGFYDGTTQNNAIMRTGGDTFQDLHQPNVKWNMEADIFFQDIGFTKDNGVDVSKYGEPWLKKRYDGITYTNALTWRCTIVERVLQIITDPHAVDHFFLPDEYGNLKPVCK
jgi:hypothetical protein